MSEKEKTPERKREVTSENPLKILVLCCEGAGYSTMWAEGFERYLKNAKNFFKFETGGVWHPNDITKNLDSDVIIVTAGTGLSKEDLKKISGKISKGNNLTKEAKSLELIEILEKIGVIVLRYSPTTDLLLQYSNVISKLKTKFKFPDQKLKILL